MMETQQIDLFSHDGLKMFAVRDLAADPVGTVVISHGLGEHCGRYETFAGELTDGGYHVYRFDHRGHGKSEGERAYAASFSHYIEDLSLVIRRAKTDFPDLPCFLFGHSMGGGIAAAYGIKTDGEVEGIILSGAATHTPKMAKGPMRPLIRTLGKLAPHIALGNSLGKLVSKDPKVVEGYLNDSLNCPKITMGLYNAFLVRGIDEIMVRAGEFCYPVLILHGGSDKIVQPAASEHFYEKCASADKTLKIYPGVYHEIFNEPERGEAVGDVLAWLSLHNRSSG